MIQEMKDVLQKTRPIWVARAILFYLLYVQIMHQQKDYGGWGWDSWLYAFAMEVSVSVGLSAIITILVINKHPARLLILLFLPVLWLGVEQSVAASQRVFHADKTEQISDESMSLEAKMARNNFITAGNALQHLRDLGVTTGGQYSNARADYERAKAEWDSVKDNTVESSSARALAATTESGNADDAAVQVATKRAWLLMGFVLLFSAVSGLWTLITSQVSRAAVMVGEDIKKPQGPSQPKQKKAQAMTLDQSLSAQPKVKKEPGISVSMLVPEQSESAVRDGAKQVIRRLRAGGVKHAETGRLCDSTISLRAIKDISTSKDTCREILREVERQGGVEIRKQGNKEVAYIAEKYRRKEEPDEVYDALKGWGGIKPETARKLADSATGGTTEDRIKSALKQHAAAA